MKNRTIRHEFETVHHSGPICIYLRILVSNTISTSDDACVV